MLLLQNFGGGGHFGIHKKIPTKFPRPFFLNQNRLDYFFSIQFLKNGKKQKIRKKIKNAEMKRTKEHSIILSGADIKIIKVKTKSK